MKERSVDLERTVTTHDESAGIPQPGEGSAYDLLRITPSPIVLR